jgi:hypothetical protein
MRGVVRNKCFGFQAVSPVVMAGRQAFSVCALEARITGARLEIIAGARHFMFAGDPPGFYAAVLAVAS